jgi:hypothetical protein
VDPDGLSPTATIIRLSKKLWGKVMKGHPGSCKRPRVKVYSDKDAQNYTGIKIFKDGTTDPPNAKLPKEAIDKASGTLPAIIPFIGNLLDPFDADDLSDEGMLQDGMPLNGETLSNESNVSDSLCHDEGCK